MLDAMLAAVLEEQASWPSPSVDLDGARFESHGTVEVRVTWHVPLDAADRIGKKLEALVPKLPETVRPAEWTTVTLAGGDVTDGDITVVEALESRPERVRVVGFGPKHDGICEVPRGTIARFRAKVTERDATEEERARLAQERGEAIEADRVVRVREAEWAPVEP